MQVRKQGTGAWFDYPNTNGIERVSNLEPNTTYECRVRGEGNNITGNWSNIANFTTSGPPNYNCNDQTLPYNTSPAQPLPLNKAVNGLIIQSGQFEVMTTQIEPSGTPGWYKGRGYALVFGALPVAVKWNNIFIDVDSRQQQGVIEALTDGIDKWMSQWDLTMAEQNGTYVNGTIDTVFMNGNQVCYTIQGSSGPICVPTPTGTNLMVIRDGEGNQYAITFVPPPPKITGPTNYLNYSNDSLDASDNEIVFFTASAGQNYGFDKKEYAAFIKNYEAIKLRNGKNYFVPNKSIGLSQTDEVLAQIQIAGYNANQLSFKTANGTLLTYATTNIANQVKITGIPSNASNIYAWYNNKKIGKLNIMSLKAITKKVFLVPVNNSNVSVTGAQLNEIFKQANVTWSVTTVANFTFNLGNDGLEAADAKLMSKYSAEMRALRNAFKNFDTLYDKEAYYLFIVPSFSNQNLKGYMVRGRAVGFVSADASTKEIAHELAHGAFALEHTFPAIEKGTSNNLMDYMTGLQLNKEQWMYITLGNADLNWFDSEEDASYYYLLHKENLALGVFNWINKIKLASKNNTSITIPGNTYLIGKVMDGCVGGIQYDSICVYVQDRISEETALVKNKISIATRQKTIYSVAVTYSCISIDGGKIIIEVPAVRLPVMLNYLQSTQTFKNLMLFVNGYRPVLNRNGDPIKHSLAEYDDSNNEITPGDFRGYWKGIDAKFMSRIGTQQAVYADGHHGVRTSNHGGVLEYGAANLESEFAKEICTLGGDGVICYLNHYLHTTPNIGGFVERQNSGDKAAQELILKINQGTCIFNKLIDTLDIVSHSMGYAYAVGMIKRLKSVGIKFGRFYIIAPENALGGGDDWNKFTEVWQYGSNLDQDDHDPYYLQDGVAPQCAVPNINKAYAKTKNGRVFIPPSITTKSFLGSHSIANYGWIFDIINGDPKGGYVKPRN